MKKRTKTLTISIIVESILTVCIMTGVAMIAHVLSRSGLPYASNWTENTVGACIPIIFVFGMNIQKRIHDYGQSIDGAIYDWMMRKLPTFIMYKYTQIDTQHKMLLPRWGFSKEQIEEAKESADELAKNLNIE